MGQSKAMLPIGRETMLERMVRIVGEVASPVIVVASPGQELPELPAHVCVVQDREPDRGPLEGLYVGLSQLPADCLGAFVTSCDAPLLTPGFVRYVTSQLSQFDAVVPLVDDQCYPLSAAYRRSVLPIVEGLLGAKGMGPRSIFDRVSTRYLTRSELEACDPALDSLRNLNDPADYAQLLEQLRTAGKQPRGI